MQGAKLNTAGDFNSAAEVLTNHHYKSRTADFKQDMPKWYAEKGNASGMALGGEWSSQEYAAIEAQI